MGSPFCEGICPWPYLRWLRSESDRNGESLGRPLRAPKSHDVRPTLHPVFLRVQCERVFPDDLETFRAVANANQGFSAAGQSLIS